MKTATNLLNKILSLTIVSAITLSFMPTTFAWSFDDIEQPSMYNSVNITYTTTAGPGSVGALYGGLAGYMTQLSGPSYVFDPGQYTFEWDACTDLGDGYHSDVIIDMYVGSDTGQTTTDVNCGNAITIDSVDQASAGAEVIISYSLFGEDAGSADLFDYAFQSDNAGAGGTMTEGTSGDGTTGLSTSPSGESHTFAWDACGSGDIGSGTWTDVEITLEPSDGSIETISNITVNCAAPIGDVVCTSQTGGNVFFEKADGADWTQAANQDRISSNVWITRQDTEGLYNINTEASYTGSISPEGTAWAPDSCSNSGTYSSFSGPFDTWYNTSQASRTGVTVTGPPSYVNQPSCLYLTNEDEYYDITFDSWTQDWQSQTGGFSYYRCQYGSATGPTNTAPSISVTGTSQRGDGDHVDISYTAYDDDSDDVEFSSPGAIEYRINDGSWDDIITEVTGDGLHDEPPVSASPGGDSHGFVWNACSDVNPGTYTNNTDIRLTPYDGTDAGFSETYDDFSLDCNTSPTVVITSASQASQGANLSIDFNLSDPDSETDIDLNSIQYDAGSGYNDITTFTGDSQNLTVAGNPHNINWDICTDLGSTSGTVDVRLQATDNKETGVAASENSISFDCTPANSPATIAISAASQRDDRESVDITYTATDTESDGINFENAQYRVDDGSWTSMTADTGATGPAHDSAPVTSSPTGESHTFVWDVCTDLDGQIETDVDVRLTPNDGSVGTGDTEENFSIDCAQDFGEEAELTNPEDNVLTEYGKEIALDGDYLVVSAPGRNNYSGAAWVYKRNGVLWEKQNVGNGGCNDSSCLIPAGLSQLDEFGYSVDIDGDYIAISSLSYGTVGQVFVYKRDGTNWNLDDQFEPDDAASIGGFGGRLSLDGTYMAVSGAETDGTGNTYIFQRSGSSWSQIQKIMASDGESTDNFGIDVDLSGNYLVVGAYTDQFSGNNAGAVYLYETSTSWTTAPTETKITPSDRTATNSFGFQVATEGSYIAIADSYHQPVNGKVYIFDMSGTELALLSRSVENQTAQADISLDIEGDIVVVGYPSDTRVPGTAGAACVFEKPASGWTDMTETRFIQGNDTDANDSYGTAVAISGDWFAVSALLNTGSPTGSIYMNLNKNNPLSGTGGSGGSVVPEYSDYIYALTLILSIAVLLKARPRIQNLRDQ